MIKIRVDNYTQLFDELIDILFNLNLNSITK